MKSYISQNKRNLIILLMILISISVTASFYLQKKSGYYVDEGMTLFLANGQYNGGVTTQSEFRFQDFLKEYVWKDTFSETIQNVLDMLKQVMGAGNYSEEGTVEWYDATRKMLQGESDWMDGADLYQQITVSSKDRFDYLQVYINQAMDVHPPLYYFIVHTVFSIFAGKYSDAYLFGINLFFLLTTCVVIYFLLQKLLNRPELSLGVVAVYGFSQGFLSCAFYFRMYAMETFAVIITLYLYICMQYKNWQCTRKDRFLLGMTAVMGFMVHYYYILFLVPLFVITCIRMGKAHRVEDLKKYVRTMILSGVVSICFWPFSLYHIFFGYRGTEAISNLNMIGLWGKFLQCTNAIKTALFLNNSWIMLLAMVVLTSYLIFRLNDTIKSFRGKVNFTEGKMLKCSFELWIPMVFYCLIVVKVAPVVADRYIMCLFPIILMLVGIALYEILSRISLQQTGQIGVAVIICALYIVVSLGMNTPNYLYLEQAGKKLGYEESREEVNCLMIADDDYRGFPEAVKLAEFNQVMVVGSADMDLLLENFPKEQEKEMILYVFEGLDVDEIVRTVKESLHREAGCMKEIESDIIGFKAYVL